MEIRNRDSLDAPVIGKKCPEMWNERQRKHVRDGGAMPPMNIDRWVGNLVDEEGLPVIL